MTSSRAFSRVVLGRSLNSRARTLSSLIELSSTTLHAAASVAADRSRSFRLRMRAFLSAFSALLNRSRSKASRTSSASSCAVASRQSAKATSVAIRRDAGSRLIAVTLAVLAKRARAAIRLGGMCAAAGKVMPMPRTSSSRRSARINAGPLTMTGPERN
ncbi:hypothetical protein M770_34505 (plasmid) [Pseudomonas aeruginosa VRFPA03]|nr:hypothetical protein M770_34505 [Pseudomonas aeruginosa VRFPA03]